jgi:hypothetical protein
VARLGAGRDSVMVTRAEKSSGVYADGSVEELANFVASLGRVA